MHRLKFTMLTLCLLAVLAACGPAPTPVATPAVAPTTAPTVAAAAPSAQPTVAAASPTQAPTALPPTAAPTSAPTSAPTTAPAAPVRIAVQATDNTVSFVDPTGGKGPTFKSSDPADVSSISGFGNVQAGTLYLPLSGRQSTVVRFAANGPQTLDWIKGPINGLAVSPGYIAWGRVDQSGAKPVIQLMLSALDGTGIKTVLSDSASAGPLVYKPLRWSQDGKRLYFAHDPMGLGGYILFGGFTDLWALDPATGKPTQLLAPRANNSLVCIDDLSPNEKFVADHCNPKHIEVVAIAGGKATIIDPPANVTGVGLVGGARFSPDSGRVAYGLARHIPGNEQGWVAVSDTLSGNSNLIATSPTKDYFSVAAWLDANTLVLQSNGPTPGIWLARADGTSTKRVADGIFTGLLNSQPTALACGAVRALGPTVPSEPAALQAEDCFFQAFQVCQPATLTFTQMGVDAGVTDNFAIESQGAACRITGTTVRYIVPRPTPVPDQFVCQALTRRNGGLLFSGCGAQGDIMVPAP